MLLSLPLPLDSTMPLGIASLTVAVSPRSCPFDNPLAGVRVCLILTTTRQLAKRKQTLAGVIGTSSICTTQGNSLRYIS